MHNPTDRIAHTTAFVTPVMEHWLEREIAQWVHPMKDRSDDPSHHERTLLPRSYISLPQKNYCKQSNQPTNRPIDQSINRRTTNKETRTMIFNMNTVYCNKWIKSVLVLESRLTNNNFTQHNSDYFIFNMYRRGTVKVMK